jgi:hypothetical protein
MLRCAQHDKVGLSVASYIKERGRVCYLGQKLLSHCVL